MKNKEVSKGCVRKVRRQKTSANYLRIYKNAGVTVGGFSNAHDAPKHRQVSFSTGFTGLLRLGSAGRLLLPSAKVSCDMSERSGRACPPLSATIHRMADAPRRGGWHEGSVPTWDTRIVSKLSRAVLTPHKGLSPLTAT